jgi:glucose-1-phosphate adenylyltransferase
MIGGKKVLALVLAGGEGARLHPLTAERCKPSVPFNGRHRIVDFVLSNLVNSGLTSIYLLVQYKSQPLIEHVRRAWSLPPLMGHHFVSVVPPQMRHGREWYAGTADAVAQNLHLLDQQRPDLVAVFGADHVYRMDVSQMVDWHLAQRADVTVATLPVPINEAPAFGIATIDAEHRITAFEEKPRTPRSLPGRPGFALASMGNYVFSASVLREALAEAQARGEHDFGRDVLPRLIGGRRVVAYDFDDNRVPGLGEHEERGYWRDVGTLDAYFAANFDTLGARPRFRMANPAWPIHTAADTGESAQVEAGHLLCSTLGPGSVVHDGWLDHALLRQDVQVHEEACLEHCILMDRVVVGRGARLRRVIVDMDNHVPPGEVIGHDPAADRARFHVSEGGIVVVPRGHFRPGAAVTPAIGTEALAR